MLGKLFPVALTITFCTDIALADRAKNTLEISPLKAAIGQPSAAWQRVLTPGIEGRVFAEYIRQNGLRDDYEDALTTLQLGLDFPLPFKNLLQGVFVGAGLAYQHGLIGGRAERAYISSMRPDERGLDDRWVNKVQYLSAYQSVGYRHFMGEHVSVAIRFVVDELLQKSETTVSEEVLSYAVDSSAKGRAQVTQSLSLFAGLHF